MHKKILLTTILLCLNISSIYANPVRGLWVVRYAITDKNEVDKIMATAKSLNITDLYVQVRALGQTYGLEESGSPFKLLVKRAKNEKIRIHAWLNVLYIWGSDSKPSDNSHLLYRSTKSLLRAASDQKIPQYSSLKRQGIEGFFIDPSSEANLLDIKILISDLIQNYGVDGIHLDYLRYPSFEYSFSPDGRTHFFREHWFDPINMFEIPIDTNSANPLEKYNYSSHTYKDYLRQNLTDLLIEIKQYIKQFKHSTELSIAVKPNREIARDYYFQDWGNWLTNDICDHLVIMNYDTVMSNFINNLNTALINDNKSKVLIGISTYNQDYQAVFDRIEATKRIPNGGYVIFSYNYLAENPSYFKNLIQALINFK